MACGVEVGGQLRALRRLLYCGEWIESHALHVFMLHAPDFLGYESAIELARDNPEVVSERARAQEGGERAHDRRRRPRGAPDQRQGRRLVPGAPKARARDARRRQLERAREIALETVRSTAGFDFPDFERDYELVALDRPGRVPDRPRPDRLEPRARHRRRRVRRALRRGARASGRTRSTRDHRARLLPVRAARPVGARGRPPLAGRPRGGRRGRARPGRAKPVPEHRRPRASSSSTPPTRRCGIIADYEEPDAPAVEVEPRAGVGYGCTEAPRGILYHRYELDDERHDPRRQDRAADLAEPADDRGGPARRRRALARPAATRSSRSAASRRSATTTPASPARRTS